MPIEIKLDHDRGIPVYRQITEAVMRALAAGTLGRGEQLPTIHELAARLGINPNTVVRAYKDLERDGHIVSRRGRGTFTSPQSDVGEVDRDALLRGIYDRALTDGARHGLSPRDIVRYFRRALHEK